MITEARVEENLGKILLPGVKRSLVMMNLVRSVAISDETVTITLASSAMNEGVQGWVRDKVKASLEKLAEVASVQVEFTDVKPIELNQIQSIIAVMSGKGGVGKSLVASLTAVALKRRGGEVGILDADITGPSIPRMFGIDERPGGSSSAILPVLSRSGIEVMSFNLFMPKKEEAVIWRGPLISRAITQFWEDVVWGKLDYLVVDLPPGTSDASLTVMQAIPVSGVIIVSTPQDLATMIVKKAVDMARKMGKPVLGIVENMSYLYLPEIDKRIELFGKSKGAELARAASAPLLGQLPVDPELAKLCDEGRVEQYNSDAFTSLAREMMAVLPQEMSGDN
jgi:Mrp family chromosome partitioning ATPase